MAIDFEREMRAQQVEEQVYTTFLREMDGCSEDDWRYFATKVAIRLLEGVEISLRAKLMGGDLDKQLKEAMDVRGPRLNINNPRAEV